MVQRNAVPGEWHASERETFRGENFETPVGNEEWRRRLEGAGRRSGSGTRRPLCASAGRPTPRTQEMRRT